MHNYHDVFGRFPPAAIYQGTGGTAETGGRSANWGATWAIMLLPYIEQQALYNKYNFELTARQQVSTGGMLTQRAQLPAMKCPSHPAVLVRFNQDYDGFAKGTYGANGGAQYFMSSASFTNSQYRGAFSPYGQYGASFRDITDGSSNAALISEIVGIPSGGDDRGAWSWVSGAFFSGQTASSAPAGAGVATPNSRIRWDATPYALNNPTAPVINERNDTDQASGNGAMAARSYHTGGVQVTMCDGSVRFVSDNLNANTWLYVLAIADGNILGEF